MVNRWGIFAASSAFCRSGGAQMEAMRDTAWVLTHALVNMTNASLSSSFLRTDRAFGSRFGPIAKWPFSNETSFCKDPHFEHVAKTLRKSQSFRNVFKMWFFTKRGFVRKRPFRDGAETRPKSTNCAQKASGKACICPIDEGMGQHPSRISHSFHLYTAAVTGRQRRCKYAPSVHHLTHPVLMMEHVYAFERLFSVAGHF